MDIKKYQDQVYPLIKELCKIPAPSHFEDERAKFCKDWFINAGFTSVYIDEAKNVVCEYNAKNSNELTVFAAHTDTVFPDTTPYPFKEEGNRAYCMGISDDTASVAVMMISAKYLLDNNLIPEKGMLFVCNSCEEGLGDLKGTRNLMKNYAGRIKRFISYDSSISAFYTECVGSHRYNVKVETTGGHSFSNFGRENAIANLANMISEIYKIEVPKIGDSHTTYNVGIVNGGTSVNTIAQSAEMLCEYRSDNVECLAIMQEKFQNIFKNAEKEDVKIVVTKVGDRPCAKGVDPKKLDELLTTCKSVYEKIANVKIAYHSGSTDCNMPMSLGIPSVAVGVRTGGGVHTREEFLDIDSLPLGFELSINLMQQFLK